jgi:nucleoside-diphosphate-sugar epimerase
VPRVAVIGAAGYVGRLLCTRLVEDGTSVTGVVRSSSGFLLDQLGIEWVAVEDAGKRAPFDVVVNLAYPTSGSVYSYSGQNHGVLATVRRLAGPSGRVIQVSTEAVFGMALEYPQTPAPLPMRPDFIYVESKLELECILIAELAGYQLDIVRIGNVWGPGSAVWTGGLAQRLLFGEAVLSDRDGFSNITDVENLVSYLAFLTRMKDRCALTRFHHLSELGQTRWSHWIGLMSNRLGVEPVTAAAPTYSLSAREDVHRAIAAHSPLAVVRDLKNARFTGSALRSIVGGLPPSVARALRRRWASSRSPANGGQPSAREDQFLTVLGCEVRFVPVLDSSWTPPIDEDASWRAVSAWLDEVGYT